MDFEQELKTKQYYKKLTMDQKEPLRVLGEQYYAEQKKDVYDLSFIRFAQGEQYYQIKDFETAVFKWESIHNELQPWAKKNVADAYVQLGLVDDAEKVYRTITTESVLLKMEIGLSLFYLYRNLGKTKRADETIKDILNLNPDYPGVTQLAKNFFENNEDWKSAIDLAINEGKRKKSTQWFIVLKSYIDDGKAQNLAPNYFEDTLLHLKEISVPQFQQLLSSLWKHYESTDQYLVWVDSFNQLFKRLLFKEQGDIQPLQHLFLTIFYSLVAGRYLITDIKRLIPDLLSNWNSISSEENRAHVSCAITAWNDYIPETLEPSMVEGSEYFISGRNIQINSYETSKDLLESIKNWATLEEIDLVGLNSFVDYECQESLQNVTEDEQNEVIYSMIGELLHSLLEKKEEQEKTCESDIRWTEEVLTKLNAALYQLDDWKYSKHKNIQKAFTSQKEEIRLAIMNEIPSIVKSCTDIVNEQSDIRNLEQVIQIEMNKRVEEYLQGTIMPVFRTKFQEWLHQAEVELKESQLFVEELAGGFTPLLNGDLLDVTCDFQVLNDWKRDMERLTNYLSYEDENFFQRTTPSHLFMKGAGKLFGSIQQNQSFFITQYHRLIENEDYTEIATIITTKFLQQLELFEKSIQRDVQMFFQQPVNLFKSLVVRFDEMKKNNEALLIDLKSNPEKFYDPIVLFQIRHRILEWHKIGHTEII